MYINYLQADTDMLICVSDREKSGHYYAEGRSRPPMTTPVSILPWLSPSKRQIWQRSLMTSYTAVRIYILICNLTLLWNCKLSATKKHAWKKLKNHTDKKHKLYTLVPSWDQLKLNECDCHFWKRSKLLFLVTSDSVVQKERSHCDLYSEINIRK